MNYDTLLDPPPLQRKRRKMREKKDMGRHYDEYWAICKLSFYLCSCVQRMEFFFPLVMLYE